MTSATPALDASAMVGPGLAETESHGIPDHIYRRRWVILGALCLSLMIVVIANTSLNVALPTMSESLGLSNSAQQWVIDAYSLVFAGLLFTAGSLGDRWAASGSSSPASPCSASPARSPRSSSTPAPR